MVKNGLTPASFPFIFAFFKYKLQFLQHINVTDDRPYMIILDLIRPFRSYMVRPYMV